MKNSSATYEEWFEALAEEGIVLAPLLDKPELFDWLHVVYNAFWDLDASRPVLQGPGPIPYSEVTCWLTEQGFEGDAREMIRRLLTETDRAYLESIIERRDKTPANKT